MGQLSPRLRFGLPSLALGTLMLLCGVALPARAQELEVNLPPDENHLLDPDKLDPGIPMNTDEQLAQQLNNPLASVISVPIQNNFDYGLGRNEQGFRYTLVAQPVVPFKLSNDWNLITRTVIPFATVDRVFPNSETGLGDIVQSLWFSPARQTNWGLTWGVGPAILYPSATNRFLGGRQWAAGPTGVAVVTRGPWLGLLLANQLWSLGGTPEGRQQINLTFVQAALAYTTQTRTTFFVSTESTYDYTTRRGTVPLQLGINQLLRIGGVPFQLGGLVRYYVDTPAGGPTWGFQLRLTLVFPK